jgi:hypothetical protein
VFYTTTGIGGGTVSYVTVSGGVIDDEEIYGYADGSPEYPEDESEEISNPKLYEAYKNSGQEIKWNRLDSESLDMP